MTGSEKDTGAVLKRDKRGRVRSTPQQRRAVLEQYARSGLSGPEFARVTGVCYQTFACWRLQHRKADLGGGAGAEAATSTSVRLVEAVMAPTLAACPTSARSVPRSGTLHITLPGGASFEVAELAQVPLAAGLIQALRLPC